MGFFGFPSSPGGAPDPRNCRRNRGSEAPRSSRSSKLSTKSRFRGSAELQILENVNEIEVQRLRGAPDPRKCRRYRSSEAPRSSRSSRFLTESRFGGFAELQDIDNVDEIKLRRLCGAPVFQIGGRRSLAPRSSARRSEVCSGKKKKRKEKNRKKKKKISAVGSLELRGLHLGR